MKGLNLHSGGELVPYAQLAVMPTPPRTETHVPLPHYQLIDMVKYALGYYGHQVQEEHYAIDKGGDRFFALLSLRSEYGDYTDTVGLRNSHDRSFSIGIAFGARVFVCSNLSFRGDHVIRRKHTTHSKRDLPGLVAEIIEPLKEEREAQYKRVIAYKESDLSEKDARNAIVRLYEEDVINVQRIPQVLESWKEPQHKEWAHGKVWTLFNAVTFALQGTVMQRPAATTQLHQIMDELCAH